MVRAFAPTSFTVSTERFAELREATLSHSGEYVYHMPIGGDTQAVVVHFQYIPVDASISHEFVLSGTNPKIYALADHFEVLPRDYKEGHSGRANAGSQFEVQGITYNVKSVTVNHRGYMTIELVQDDKCTSVRAEFSAEMEALLCSLET